MRPKRSAGILQAAAVRAVEQRDRGQRGRGLISRRYRSLATRSKRSWSGSRPRPPLDQRRPSYHGRRSFLLLPPWQQPRRGQRRCPRWPRRQPRRRHLRPLRQDHAGLFLCRVSRRISLLLRLQPRRLQAGRQRALWLLVQSLRLLMPVPLRSHRPHSARSRRQRLRRRQSHRSQPPLRHRLLCLLLR